MRKSPKRVVVKKSSKSINNTSLWDVVVSEYGVSKVFKTFISKESATIQKKAIQKEWSFDKVTKRIPREQLVMHKAFCNEL